MLRGCVGFRAVGLTGESLVQFTRLIANLARFFQFVCPLPRQCLKFVAMLRMILNQASLSSLMFRPNGSKATAFSVVPVVNVSMMSGFGG